MDEAVVSPDPPRKKSSVGCLIAGLGLGCLGVLLVAAIIAFFFMGRFGTSGERLPAPVASPAAEASPEFQSDLGTPSDQETPDTGGETSPPLVAPPVKAGSLDEMLDSIASEPQMGNSRADSTLRRDVLRTIVTSLASDGCAFSVQRTRVLHEPDSSGVWTESWDLMICGKPRHLRIKLTPTAGGGVDFAVSE